VLFRLRGKLPFDHDEKEELINLTLHAELSFEDPNLDEISDDCKDFLNGLLNRDVQKRMSADQALQHRWILGSKSGFKTDSKPRKFSGTIKRHHEQTTIEA